MNHDEDTSKSASFSDTELLVCPSCKSFNRFYDLQRNSLGVCYMCKTVLWVEDCTKMTIKYSWLADLTTADYIEAIDKGMGNTTEREIYLRKMLWWNLNDVIRDNPDDTSFSVAQEELFNNNLRRLLDLIEEGVLGVDFLKDDRITKAEIYRELGEFEAALLVLSDIPETDSHHHRAVEIKGLCNNDDKKVRQVGTLRII